MKHKKTLGFLFLFFLLTAGCFLSCDDTVLKSDEYYLTHEEPDWLGESIYDYLEKDGRFSYFIRIINDVEDDGVKYSEVLKKTGSKTLFVATDKAFETFFNDNTWGVRRFEDLSLAQRRSILFAGMLNNPYLVEMLSNISASPPTPGQCLRRTTDLSVLDSIPFEKGDQLPQNKYWERFKDKGIYILKDNTPWTMVHFLEPQMKAKGITDEDFYTITHLTRQAGEAYIFDIKIVEKDITCKNGYINVLEKVLYPRSNMAEYIRGNKDTRTFNRFLERFCAPRFNKQLTDAYRQLHPEFTDSIFEKKYFNSQSSHSLTVDPDNNRVEGLLSFDPGWNSFSSDGTATGVLTDMGAIFVPSDQAFEKYFQEGEGAFLRERYGSWDNVPNDVLNALINNHLKPSFITSVPSRFNALADKMGTPMDIQPEDIEYAYVCTNGVVYVTNKVYSPTEYAAVTSPIMTNANTRIFNWAIESLQFNLYLLSMVNKFSFFAPTDDVFNNYINPMTMHVDKRMQRWKFWYNPVTTMPNIIVYDVATGDSVSSITNSAIISNILSDILDNHIVVGDIEDGDHFYKTKGGATLEILKNGSEVRVWGGGNKLMQEDVRVTRTYSLKNGKTYLIDRIIQTPLESVLNVMKSREEFSAFYELCADAKPAVADSKKPYDGRIFANMPSIGITENVVFFSTYHYTIYIPTNEAIKKAHDAGMFKTWDEIELLPTLDERKAESQKLYNLLRYHFQDNSVYLSNEKIENEAYETATREPLPSQKFYKLTLYGDKNNLTITTASGKTAKVTTNPALYNLMARDYKFNAGNINSASQISTSSFAVIHQIDAVLNFQ